MNRPQFSSALVLILVISFLYSNSLAQSTHSQGFYWGYKADDRIDFVETHSYDDPDEGYFDQWFYYLITPPYSEIPDPLTPNDTLPISRGDIYYLNGTLMQEPKVVFAVPLGNCQNSQRWHRSRPARQDR